MNNVRYSFAIPQENGTYKIVFKSDNGFDYLQYLRNPLQQLFTEKIKLTLNLINPLKENEKINEILLIRENGEIVYSSLFKIHEENVIKIKDENGKICGIHFELDDLYDETEVVTFTPILSSVCQIVKK